MKNGNVRIVYDDPHFIPRDDLGNPVGDTGYRYAVYTDAETAMQQAVNDMDKGGSPLRIESVDGKTVHHDEKAIRAKLGQAIEADKKAAKASDLYLSRQERDGKLVLPE